jgi:ribonuclease III
MVDDLDKAQKAIGYLFKDQKLLLKALTHKSYAAETGSIEFNERLEFLGDSILSAVVADYLFNRYPENDEGRLSQIKSQIVSGQHLNRWAKKIKLGNFLYVSKGEELNGARARESLLADTFEAVIAAIYIDSGFGAAEKFVHKFLVLQQRIVINDSKSKLQELIQSKYQTLPEYRVLQESGPDHDKVFEMGVYLKKKQLGAGSGRCKKDAEQSAAKIALKTLKIKYK